MLHSPYLVFSSTPLQKKKEKMYYPFSKGFLLKKNQILAYYSTITPIFPSPPPSPLFLLKEEKKKKKSDHTYEGEDPNQ